MTVSLPPYESKDKCKWSIGIGSMEVTQKWTKPETEGESVFANLKISCSFHRRLAARMHVHLLDSRSVTPHHRIGLPRSMRTSSRTQKGRQKHASALECMGMEQGVRAIPTSTTTCCKIDTTDAVNRDGVLLPWLGESTEHARSNEFPMCETNADDNQQHVL